MSKARARAHTLAVSRTPSEPAAENSDPATKCDSLEQPFYNTDLPQRFNGIVVPPPLQRMMNMMAAASKLGLIMGSI